MFIPFWAILASRGRARGELRPMGAYAGGADQSRTTTRGREDDDDSGEIEPIDYCALIYNPRGDDLTQEQCRGLYNRQVENGTIDDDGVPINYCDRIQNPHGVDLAPQQCLDIHLMQLEDGLIDIHGNLLGSGSDGEISPEDLAAYAALLRDNTPFIPAHDSLPRFRISSTPTRLIVDSELSLKPPTVSEESYFMGDGYQRFFSAQRRKDLRIVANNMYGSDKLRQIMGSIYVQKDTGFSIATTPPVNRAFSFRKQLAVVTPVRTVEFANLFGHLRVPGRDRDESAIASIDRVITDLTENGFFYTLHDAGPQIQEMPSIGGFQPQFERSHAGETLIIEPRTPGQYMPAGVCRVGVTFDLAHFVETWSDPFVAESFINRPYDLDFKRLFLQQGMPTHRRVPLDDATAKLERFKDIYDTEASVPARREYILDAVKNLNDFLNSTVNIPAVRSVEPLGRGEELINLDEAFYIYEDAPELFWDHTFSHEDFLNDKLTFDTDLKFGHYSEEYAYSFVSPASRDTSFVYKYLPNAYSLYLATRKLITDDVIFGTSIIPAFSLKNTFLTSIEDDLLYLLFESIRAAFGDTYYDRYSRAIKNIGTARANEIATDPRNPNLNLNRMNQVFFDSTLMSTIAPLEDEFERVIPFLNRISVNNSTKSTSPDDRCYLNLLSGIPRLRWGRTEFLIPADRIGYNIFKLTNILLSIYQTGAYSTNLPDRNLAVGINTQGFIGEFINVTGNKLFHQHKKSFTALGESNMPVVLKQTNLLDVTKPLEFYIDPSEPDRQFSYGLFNGLYRPLRDPSELLPKTTLSESDVRTAESVEVTSPKDAAVDLLTPASPIDTDGQYTAMRAQLFRKITDDFKNRTYLNAILGEASPNQPIAYKVIKAKNDSTSLDQQQEFIIPYARTSEDEQLDVFSYLDSQINFDTSFTYELRLLVCVAGLQYYYRNFIGKINSDEFTYKLQADVVQSPSTKIIEVPLHKLAPGDKFYKRVVVLDKPPTAPDVEFLPFKDINNKVRFILNPTMANEFHVPIIIDEIDNAIYSKIREAQGVGPENLIEFDGDSAPDAYVIYRVDNPPTDYTDFAGSRRFVSTLISERGAPRQKRSVTAVFDDNVQPNRKYYYCFRALDKTTGILSNPTKVFEMELISVDAAILPRFKEYDFNNSKFEKEINFKRYLKIKPSTVQEMLKTSKFFNPDDSLKTSNEVLNIPFVGDGDSVFGKNFKAEIVSTKTGRKIFINFKFTRELRSETIIERPTASPDAIGGPRGAPSDIDRLIRRTIDPGAPPDPITVLGTLPLGTIVTD